MQRELLECLVRLCVREVLNQVKRPGLSGNPDVRYGRFDEADEEPTKGAAAPPEGGQGTADQPAIPKNDKPEEPDVPVSPELKGALFVNPRDKSKLEKLSLRPMDDATLERTLHRLVSKIAGSGAKVALSTMRMVKDVIRNPSTAVYLYVGKYDPSSDEIFLMSDKSLQVAKDSSVSASELTGTPVSVMPPEQFHALTASPEEFAQRMTTQGQAPSRGVDERLGRIVKKMINEILDKE